MHNTCNCIHPVRASTRVLIDIDINHLYYSCNECKRVHSRGHNEIPHFECITKFDVYQSCVYSKFNQSVKKLCASCCSAKFGFNMGYVSFCPKCKIHILHFLNGKQIPIFDAKVNKVALDYGVSFTENDDGSCSVTFN